MSNNAALLHALHCRKTGKLKCVKEICQKHLTHFGHSSVWQQSNQQPFEFSWSNQLRPDKEFGLILTVLVMTKMSRAFTFPKTCKMNTNRAESSRETSQLRWLHCWMASLPYMSLPTHMTQHSAWSSHTVSPWGLPVCLPSCDQRLVDIALEESRKGLKEVSTSHLNSYAAHRVLHTLTVHTLRFKSVSHESDTDWIHLKTYAFAANWSTKSHLVMTSICQQSIKVQCTLHGYITWQKKKEHAIKIPKGTLKSSPGTLPVPPPSPSPSLSSSLPQSALPLSYFCLLSAQRIPFRPRWLLLRRAAVWA